MVLKRLRNRLFQSDVQVQQIAEIKDELAALAKQQAKAAQKFGSHIDILADLVGSLMYPDAETGAARTNQGICEVQQGSIATVDLGRKFDLVFSRGVLIHIQPQDRPTVYTNMERHAGKYLIIWENFSETPHHFDEYSKRVTSGKAGEGYPFCRDFAGDFQRQFPAWSVVSSGIKRKVGAQPKHGDLVWTIMQRR